MTRLSLLGQGGSKWVRLNMVTENVHSSIHHLHLTFLIAPSFLPGLLALSLCGTIVSWEVSTDPVNHDCALSMSEGICPARLQLEVTLLHSHLTTSPPLTLCDVL